MNFDEIIYDKKDRVATVTMNRPEKMNAWTPKMRAEMRTAMMDAERDPEIEHGSSWMLPRIVGLANAVELAITGRLVDANEALEMGLVNRVVPQDKLMATAREIASWIANKCSPLGVAQAKKMIYQNLFTDLATGVRDDHASMEMMTRSN